MTASFFIPTRGTCMSLVNRQGYESALVAVGRILEHRWSNPDRIIVRCQYQSAAASSPPGGIGTALASRMASSSCGGRSTAFLLPSYPVLRPTFRHKGLSRILNLGRLLAGWSFGVLAQPTKQSSRRFTDLLHSLLTVAVHDQQHEPGDEPRSWKTQPQTRIAGKCAM